MLQSLPPRPTPSWRPRSTPGVEQTSRRCGGAGVREPAAAYSVPLALEAAPGPAPSAQMILNAKPVAQSTRAQHAANVMPKNDLEERALAVGGNLRQSCPTSTLRQGKPSRDGNGNDNGCGVTAGDDRDCALRSTSRLSFSRLRCRCLPFQQQ
mgnify:FL=1